MVGLIVGLATITHYSCTLSQYLCAETKDDYPVRGLYLPTAGKRAVLSQSNDEAARQPAFDGIVARRDRPGHRAHCQQAPRGDLSVGEGPAIFAPAV